MGVRGMAINHVQFHRVNTSHRRREVPLHRAVFTPFLMRQSEKYAPAEAEGLRVGGVVWGGGREVAFYGRHFGKVNGGLRKLNSPPFSKPRGEREGGGGGGLPQPRTREMNKNRESGEA